MNFGATLGLVLMAAYGLATLLFSLLVAGFWGARLLAQPRRIPARSGSLLALRLLPSAGALFLTLTIVLPAFLINEPDRVLEPVGPLALVLAVFALAAIGHGLVRACRAWGAAEALLRNCRPAQRCVIAGIEVDIVDVPAPMVAVVGARTPRIVAASTVVAACTPEEIRQVIGHEAAHIAAHDNLKLLLLLASPDALAWMRAGDTLTARWRAAAELEADAMATGPDPRRRVALASALVKVARLHAGAAHPAAAHPAAALIMPIASDDVEARVRRLLAPLPGAPRVLRTAIAVRCAPLLPLLFALLAVPLYAAIQRGVEALLAFGR